MGATTAPSCWPIRFFSSACPSASGTAQSAVDCSGSLKRLWPGRVGLAGSARRTSVAASWVVPPLAPSTTHSCAASDLPACVRKTFRRALQWWLVVDRTPHQIMPVNRLTEVHRGQDVPVGLSYSRFDFQAQPAGRLECFRSTNERLTNTCVTPSVTCAVKWVGATLTHASWDFSAIQPLKWGRKKRRAHAGVKLKRIFARSFDVSR